MNRSTLLISVSRRVAALVIITLAVVLGGLVLGPAQNAMAANCPTAAHCYSLAIRNSGGDNWIGTKTRIYRESTSSGSQGSFYRHINSEAWFILANGTYVESGLRNGYDGDSGNVTSDSDCNCVAYDMFWSDTDSAGHQNRHIIQHTSPSNNVADIYETVRKPNAPNQWLVNVNGNNVGTSTVVSGWNSNRRDMGGEYANENTCSAAGGWANTFGMTNWLMNTSYSYVQMAPTTTIVDNYCGGINGSYYGFPGTWSWNKPS